MNDGCSVVSPAAMRLIADALGLADVSPPAAVQGRLGGAKGVWFVDPATPLESDALWIEVTESQLKYPFHDADADGEPDWARLTLFVLAHSKPPAPAHLNRQFIPLLSRAGVPFPAFAVALEAHLDAELAELTAAVHDPPALRHLLHRLAGPNREGRPHPSGAPVCHELWLAMLLEAGFTPGDCAFLATRLDARFAQECADVLARAHVRVPKSTQLFCIADPTGTLAEGEVAVQFSGGVIDPVTRYSCDALVGDVLVARNPATQGSDVQKVRAVRPADERLRRLKDVVVFSTLGDTPLASLLSGGDYDGDKPWVCWDPSFVEPFRNSSPPPPPTDPTLYVAPAAGPRTLAALPANDLSKFFATGFAAALADTQLGLCSYALEAYTYLHAPDATSSLMSWLASALVDAPKAGLMATPRTTQLLRDVCSRVRKPAYATPGAPKPSGPPEAWHVLDRLLLHTGALALDARRVSFAPAAAPPPDPDLLAPFLDAGGEPGVRGVVDRLHEQLQELMGVWNAAMRETRAPFEERVGRVWERYAAIKPDVGRAGIEGRALARRWASAAGSAEWGVMRASALVAVQRDGAAKAPWWLATGDLCRIKAAAGAGGVRCMRSEMYAGLKPVRIRVVEAE
ncbi:RNA dependent RNA polymerase-domain-containing protein [Geopyxis carbonaria]|nr:RNA dependent RNA polymerase-domain-containing protein [Geopyxis carbonaria]